MQVIHYLQFAGAPSSDGTTNTTGVPDAASSASTTAGVYGTYRGCRGGTLCADTTNGKLYENYGTPALPVWTAL